MIELYLSRNYDKEYYFSDVIESRPKVFFSSSVVATNHPLSQFDVDHWIATIFAILLFVESFDSQGQLEDELDLLVLLRLWSSILCMCSLANNKILSQLFIVPSI